MISPGANSAVNQSDRRTRWSRVRSSRSSMRRNAAMRTPKLATAAMTPTFTRSVMSWSFTS